MTTGIMTARAHPLAGHGVAVLGTGTMGAPIARNLLRAGIGVQVWNRTRAKAEGLAAEGALVAPTPAAAAADVDVLITMLTDGAAVDYVMTGPQGALSALGPDAVWVQMSTVGVEWTDRLAHLAARHGVAFVDAPVSGSTQPAENGQLVILAAGAPSTRPRLEPIFAVLARQILWLDRVGDGSRLKLALNNWLAVLVEGMAETLTLHRPRPGPAPVRDHHRRRPPGIAVRHRIDPRSTSGPSCVRLSGRPSRGCRRFPGGGGSGRHRRAVR